MVPVSWRVAAVLGALSAGLGTAAHAQTTTGRCIVGGGGAAVSDVCQKGSELFSFLMPQIGVAVSSGNPVLGEGGTLGGWGKRALSFRLTAVEGYLPRNTVPLNAVGAPVASDFGAVKSAIPLPAADVAIGLFAGVPLGLTNTGGVDVLLGASYLPKVSENDFELEPAGNGVAFSYGARVGVLQESSFIPGVSLSYMRRKLPTVDIGYTPGNEVLRITGTSVTSNSLRLVAGKRFTFLGLGGGVGRDQIVSTGGMQATVGTGGSLVDVTLSNLRQEVSRHTAFLNASFSLSIVRIVAEYGWSSAGTVRETLNGFGARQVNEGYRYGSVGLATRF